MLVININELLRETKNYNEFKVFIFVDNILVSINVPASFHFKDRPSIPMDNIKKWSEKFNLNFNLQKCNFLKGVKVLHIYQKYNFDKKALNIRRELIT